MGKRTIALLVGLAVFLFARAAYCQTTTATAKWTQIEAPATAQGFVYTITNAALPPATQSAVLANVACVAKTGGGSDCSAPMPAALLVPGTFTLTARNAVGSATSDPVTMAAPGKPGGFTFTFNFSFSSSP